MLDITESSSSTPIVTVHAESSNNKPMGFKLNGSNYEVWASIIELHATTQGNLGYLTGDTNAPDSKDPKFGKCFMIALTYPSSMNCDARLPISSKRVILSLPILPNLRQSGLNRTRDVLFR
ncbi:hypothetical protein L3X38_027825 [Prunus dulcis]|uniref:Retrotransposon Copia-like N-terminal domain-containing protein n=1 Tax=Prunus dulcis TaxID=3755 RepID=A0AAD4VNS9_PRUDU|nr:hypothetical protein L3X38_027825 [Prunus dulcis]